MLKPHIAHRQAQAVAQDHALHGIDAHAYDVEESGEQPVAGRRGAPESALRGVWQPQALAVEAYVKGVSTRKVDDLVKVLGIDGIPRSEVSRICKVLDEEV